MAQRNKNGTFKHGHAGLKPTGPQPFSILKKQLKSRDPEIISTAVEQALSGKNPAVMVFMLRKMYGANPLSNFNLSGSASEMIGQVLANVGKETPETLAEATKLIESRLKVIEFDDFEKRLQVLEDAK